MVAHHLIIKGCIRHGHLFADARLEVGHGVDGRIGKGIIKTLQRGVGIAYVEITRGKIAPGIGSVIEILLFKEDIEGSLGKIACKQRIGHTILIDIA